MPLLIGERDVRQIINRPHAMREMMDAIEGTYRQLADGEVVDHERVHLQLSEGTTQERNDHWFRMLPAISKSGGAAVRIYTLYPGSFQSSDRELLLVFDPDDGHLAGLISDIALHAFRTGAPAGVLCRYLAPAEVRRVGIVGSGRQARGMVAAIYEALGQLESVAVWSPRHSSRNRFAEEMSRHLGLTVEPVDSPQAAVGEAEIVCLATSVHEPVVDYKWIAEGTLVISVANGQVDPRLVLADSLIVFSSKRHATSNEPAWQPYWDLTDRGVWDYDQSYEFVDVISGKVQASCPGRTYTVGELVGTSLWDLSAGFWLLGAAREQDLGQSFALADGATTDDWRPFPNVGRRD